MGIFDILFRNKNKQAKNISENKVIFEEYKPQYKEYDTDKIVEIATSLNFAYNVGNKSFAGRLCKDLYMEVSPQRQGGKVLLELSSKECQVVGMAFTTIALRYDFGDPDFNSVAAENAYYCLARNLIDNNNSFVAPALFAILLVNYNLMKSKLISSYCNIYNKKRGINVYLAGDPFNDSGFEKFRNDAINFKDYIMYYALSKFYDIKNKSYLIPTDLHYYIPQESVINDFLERVSKIEDYSKESFIKECEIHFKSVYKECEETLKNF